MYAGSIQKMKFGELFLVLLHALNKYNHETVLNIFITKNISIKYYLDIFESNAWLASVIPELELTGWAAVYSLKIRIRFRS